jgi:hypothetical protein
MSSCAPCFVAAFDIVESFYHFRAQRLLSSLIGDWLATAVSYSPPPKSQRQGQIYVTTDGQSAGLSSCWQLRVCWCGAPSLTRGRVCRLQLLLALANAVIPGSESRWTHDHILLSQIRHSPNLVGQVPVFIPPRNRVVQLYPQALNFLFVTSYDSQGCGGIIRKRLHTGRLPLPKTCRWFSFYSVRRDRIENTAFNNAVNCCVCISCSGDVFVGPSLCNGQIKNVEILYLCYMFTFPRHKSHIYESEANCWKHHNFRNFLSPSNWATELNIWRLQPCLSMCIIGFRARRWDSVSTYTKLTLRSHHFNKFIYKHTNIFQSK